MMGNCAYRGTHGTDLMSSQPCYGPWTEQCSGARMGDSWCRTGYKLSPWLETAPASPPQTSLPFLPPQGRDIVSVTQRAELTPDTTRLLSPIASSASALPGHLPVQASTPPPRLQVQGSPQPQGYRLMPRAKHQPRLPSGSLAGQKCFYFSLLFPEMILVRCGQEAPWSANLQITPKHCEQ